LKYLPLTLLWVAWATIHSLMVSHAITHWAKNSLANKYVYYRIVYNAVALITFLPILVYSEMLDGKLIIDYVPPWNILQNTLIAFALIIFIWSFKQFDGLEFFGIRQLMPKSFNRMLAAQPITVITDGPYRFVRHPMYFGALIFIWSLDATWAGIITHIILSLYLIIGSFLEEKKLVVEFGTAYTQYQQRVPMLIPFISIAKSKT